MKGLLIGMLIFIVLLATLTFSYTYVWYSNNPIKYIGNQPCAENHRFNVDYPFCIDVKSCKYECEILKGNFIGLEYLETSGFGSKKLCQCIINDEVTNIW